MEKKRPDWVLMNYQESSKEASYPVYLYCLRSQIHTTIPVHDKEMPISLLSGMTPYLFLWRSNNGNVFRNILLGVPAWHDTHVCQHWPNIKQGRTLGRIQLQTKLEDENVNTYLCKCMYSHIRRLANKWAFLHSTCTHTHMHTYVMMERTYTMNNLSLSLSLSLSLALSLSLSLSNPGHKQHIFTC